MSGPPPRDNIVRSIYPGPEFRAATESDDGIGLMSGHFAVFDEWAEIDSMFEGHFLERIAPGAFSQTFKDNRDGMRVLFDHGQDPSIGNKVLGPIRTLTEDGTGAAYEVPLFDTSYNRDLLPGLKHEPPQYGASFRFHVEAETFDESPKLSTHNPKGLPERTITRAVVHEFGPVTFPAYAGASAGVRSGTDDYLRATGVQPAFAAGLRASTAEIAEAKTHVVSIAGTEIARVVGEAAFINQRLTAGPAATSTQSASRKETPVDEYVTREDKASRVAELQTIISTRAIQYPGVFPPDVQATDDAENTELDRHVADIAAWDGRQARLRQFAERQGNHDLPRDERGVAVSTTYTAPGQINRMAVSDIYDIGALRSKSRSDEEYHQNLRDNAMRSVETSTFPHPKLDPNAARGQVQNLLDYKDSRDKELALRILQTGKPAYQRAFNKLVAGRQLSEEEARSAAIAVVGTTTTGGYAVPYVFDPTIIHTGAYTNINPYRAICRVEQIVGGNVWRGVSAGAIAAQYRAEGEAMTEGGPTFALPTYTAQRADAFVTLSREALQDRPDLAAELSSIIDEGKATNEETQFSIGVGTTVYPSGMFVKNKFTVKETITNDTFAVADLDATEAALPLRHRREAVWMYARAVIRIIQGWETAYGKYFTSTLGYPAVGNPENNPGGNTGLQLLGYPVWETPSAPVTVTTDDTIVGILVSPKNYIIVDRVGMEVEIVPNLFDATTGFPTGQRGLMAIWRNTAGPVNADAGRQVNIN